jgi:hypothetical protein
MKAQTSGSFTWANGAASRKMPSETSTTNVASRRCRADAGKVERNTVRSAVSRPAISRPLRSIRGFAMKQYNYAA